MKDIYVLDVADERLKILKNILEKQGYTCYDYPSEVKFEDSGAVNYVFAPSSAIEKENIAEGAYVFYFIMDEKLKSELSGTNKLFCFTDNVVFTQKNSLLTAEGALAYVITNTDECIEDMNVLCLGYGRLGKAIVRLFNRLGVKIFAATDDERERSEISDSGNGLMSLAEANESLGNFDVIINTVPAKISVRP